MTRKTGSPEERHLDWQRNALKRILSRMQTLDRDTQSDFVLESDERFLVRNVLQELLDGGDVSKSLGIKLKRGAPRDDGYSFGVATHYFFLRETEPKEEIAAREVARHHGISLATVRRLAKNNRAASLAWMAERKLAMGDKGFTRAIRAQLGMPYRGKPA